jgi:hypothetical protein
MNAHTSVPSKERVSDTTLASLIEMCDQNYGVAERHGATDMSIWENLGEALEELKERRASNEPPDEGAVRVALRHADHATGESMDTLALKRLAEAVRAAQPPAARDPDGFAYRFPAIGYPGETFISFEMLGRRDALETIPYWLGSPPASAPPPFSEDAEDAAKWRALVGCARIRVLGTAGVYEQLPDGYAHIGLELWTKHPASSTPASIEEFEKFVAIARATATKESAQ